MKLESVVSSPLIMKLKSAPELILSVFERVPQFWNTVPEQLGLLELSSKLVPQNGTAAHETRIRCKFPLKIETKFCSR